MKIGRILFLMSALAFSQAGMANHQASDKNSAADKMWVLDVDKQLEYCHKQVGRALDELRQKDGSYDFLMEPRNILVIKKVKPSTLPIPSPSMPISVIETVIISFF